MRNHDEVVSGLVNLNKTDSNTAFGLGLAFGLGPVRGFELKVQSDLDQTDD